MINHTEGLKAIKQRIRKLLNLADSSEFEGEIHNAVRMAQRLMDEHRLDDADLTDQERTERMAKMASPVGSRLSMWERWLASAVRRAVGTTGVYFERGLHPLSNSAGIIERNKDGSPRYVRHVVFYGPGEDVQIADQLFQELRETIAAMAQLKFGGVYRGPGRSYCEGFAEALLDRTKGTASERSKDCTAIVGRTYDLAREWLRDDQGIHLVSSGSGACGQHHSGAHREGGADGARADISGKRKQRLPPGQLALPA